MLAPHGWPRGTPIHVMISRHRDGENIARATQHLGVVPIRGSRTRGGVAAGRSALRVLKEGGYVAISPDGPRGPRMRVQPGIIALARLSGAPIVPYTYAVSRRAVANSWDRFVIALPFGRGVYVWGPPLHVAADADEAAREQARLTLEERLNAQTAEADRMVGAGADRAGWGHRANGPRPHRPRAGGCGAHDRSADHAAQLPLRQPARDASGPRLACPPTTPRQGGPRPLR